jgi:hypothetical protein
MLGCMCRMWLRRKWRIDEALVFADLWPRAFLLRCQLLTHRRQLGWWLWQPLDAPSPSLNAFRLRCFMVVSRIYDA